MKPLILRGRIVDHRELRLVLDDQGQHLRARGVPHDVEVELGPNDFTEICTRHTANVSAHKDVP